MASLGGFLRRLMSQMIRTTMTITGKMWRVNEIVISCITPPIRDRIGAAAPVSERNVPESLHQSHPDAFQSSTSVADGRPRREIGHVLGLDLDESVDVLVHVDVVRRHVHHSVEARTGNRSSDIAVPADVTSNIVNTAVVVPHRRFILGPLSAGELSPVLVPAGVQQVLLEHAVPRHVDRAVDGQSTALRIDPP